MKVPLGFDISHDTEPPLARPARGESILRLLGVWLLCMVLCASVGLALAQEVPVSTAPIEVQSEDLVHAQVAPLRNSEGAETLCAALIV